MRDTFEVIVLTGRPAAGKSEVIDYLKKTPVEERRRRFHIGEFEECRRHHDRVTLAAPVRVVDRHDVLAYGRPGLEVRSLSL